MPEREYKIRSHVISPGSDRLSLGKDYHAVVGIWAKSNRISKAFAGVEVDAYCTGGWEAVVVAVDENDNVVGYGSMYKASELGKDIIGFDGAYVFQGVRRKGIYKQLLATRIAIARESGAAEVVVVTKEKAHHVNYLLRQGFRKDKPQFHGNWELRKQLV